MAEVALDAFIGTVGAVADLEKSRWARLRSTMSESPMREFEHLNCSGFVWDEFSETSFYTNTILAGFYHR